MKASRCAVVTFVGVSHVWLVEVLITRPDPVRVFSLRSYSEWLNKQGWFITLIEDPAEKLSPVPAVNEQVVGSSPLRTSVRVVTLLEQVLVP